MTLLKRFLNLLADNALAWFMPKWRRRGCEILSALVRYINYYRPRIKPDTMQELEDYRRRLDDALLHWKREETERVTNLIANGPYESLKGMKRNPLAESVESLFVILVVFLGIRTYYAQPFRIPTGSMQPTLNGIIIHPVDELPGLPQRMWDAVTLGSSYVDAVSDTTKRIKNIEQRTKYLLFTETVVTFTDNSTLSIPCASGVVYEYFRSRNKILDTPLGVPIMRNFHPGETIIRARVDAGDMIVVNRMAYHFRAPRRGEPFVFDTRGINTRGTTSAMTEQSAGTHYIKRLCGLPGDTISISQPQLIINGAPATEPGIARVEDCRPPYNATGYNPAETSQRTVYLGKGDTITLRSPSSTPNLREYLALGDNTVNSLDSRYWGPVRQFNIIGPAGFTLWPFTSHWGSID